MDTRETGPRHVVVFGGTGFVGRNLAARLLEDGARVVVPSRRDGHPRERPGLPTGAELRRGDVEDPRFLRETVHGAHAVVNLVGILNERGDDGRGFERVFVDFPRRIMEAMQAGGVRRLLQMSALNAGRGDSHYLQARGRAESLVRASGLDWTLFRPSVIAGPGDGLFCRFDALLRFAPVLPIGRADACFQPVWVEDVAEAFAVALGRDDTIGQAYDLVGPERMTLREIVELAGRATGRRRLVLSLPAGLGRLQAEVGEHLPGKPISRDNWRSLRLDSTSDADGLRALGITPTEVRPLVGEMLARG